MELPKKYNPKEYEPRLQKWWRSENLFVFDPKKPGEKYIIDTPPPTLSGKMHIGHAFSYAQQDFIARFWRMKGFNVYYPFGTDDNGLPTERMVEKLKKVKSTRMERPDFVKLCRETIAEVKGDFIQYWIEIGMSCDFSNIYSTIDPHSVKTSQKSFLDLYNKELVARKEAPSMWCVNCQTAIAQAELEDKELSSTFNDVTFKTTDGKDITIATTRPELLPGCVCIFVHPTDERYKDLVGKKVIVPLFKQEVEVFADESADPEKGSGILMICSYGDRFDVDAINKKGLEPRISFTKEGKLNELGGEFEGMKIKEARTAILEKLDKEELLTASKQINHVVNVHDKCGTEIEFLTTKQWFIKVIENKKKFLDAGNEISWHPKSMKVRYDHWIENLNWDWCISRQRHFGVPFPIWYTKDGKVILPKEEQLPVDPLVDVPEGYKKEDLLPEMDVMDTWATSSMTPQIITNWVGDEGFKLKFDDGYPMALRPQAHDIIRTWAFYTIVKGIYHHNKIPWKNISISGNVSDPKGEKMSKSKGNVVNPRDTIEKYSADALRFWAAASKLGEDLSYQEKELVTGQKFVNKMWNASKFAIMMLKDYKKTDIADVKIAGFDRWVISKINKIIKTSTDSFEQYEYNKTKAEVDNFFWHTFCDNYLEIAKDRLYNPDVRGQENSDAAKVTLYTALIDVIKMMAPFTPHITDAVWQLYFDKIEDCKSVHSSKWPEYNEKLINEDAEKIGDQLIEVLSAVRKAKNEASKSLKEPVKRIVLDKSLEKSAEPFIYDLKAVTNAEVIEFGEPKIEL